MMTQFCICVGLGFIGGDKESLPPLMKDFNDEFV